MKKRLLLIIILIIGIALIGKLYQSYSISIKEYSSEDFKIDYDSTWKVKAKKEGLVLEHKKSGSIFKIQSKILDNNYIDTKLDDLITDIRSSIEKQNEDYYLINYENISGRYEAYSYLYEKDMQQVLVNIYKQDNKLVIVFYEAPSEYYDIVLDSVDEMLDSLEIITGEKVN